MIQNGWGRDVLRNWLSTDLYEQEGKAQTNFVPTMPPGLTVDCAELKAASGIMHCKSKRDDEDGEEFG